MKKKVLIICFSHLHRDPRILRQIGWLKETFDITTLGYSASNIKGVRHIQYDMEWNRNFYVKLKRLAQFSFNRYESFYWNASMKKLFARTAIDKYDFIVANDIETLPLAVKLAGKTGKVIFDAHEYAALEHEESLKFRLFQQPFVRYLNEKYILKAAKAVTVCRGIADLFEENYGKKFEIITNASEYREIKPSPVNAQKIRLIYHGGAVAGRRLENQIRMMDFLNDRFELNLMLLGDENYIKNLKKIAGIRENIKFLPPVAFEEIVDFSNRFDVGIYSLAPTNTNNRLALPNKLFEYVQARLAVAISPSPEMRRIVEGYDLGVVAEDFKPQSLAKVIGDLTAEKIEFYKKNADRHAFELSAEKNKEIYLSIFNC